MKYLKLFILAFIIAILVIPCAYNIPVEAAPSDCYWVGGTGTSSDDDNHWATTSGGSPSDGNMPDSSSNVHFDDNSFTGTGQSFTLDNDFACNNMVWTGVLYTPEFDLVNYTVDINGDLIFALNMSINDTGSWVRLNGTSNTITTNGVYVGISYLGVYDENAVYALVDDYTGGGIEILGGTFDTGENDLDLDYLGLWLYYGDSLSFDMTNSTIEVDYISVYGKNSATEFICDGGTIDLNQTSMYIDNFGGYLDGETAYYLTLDGLTINMLSGSTYGICDYLELENCSATGDSVPTVWYAGVNSIDNGNNTGWIFGEYDYENLDAFIVYGSNPDGVTLLINSMATGNLVAAGSITRSVDLLQEGGTTDYTTMDVPDNPISPIIEAITSIMSLAGSPFTVPEQIVWILAFTILIMGMMFLSMKYMPNQLIGSIVCIGLSILAWKMAIYPFAMVIFVVVGCIAILVWERKPSL